MFSAYQMKTCETSFAFHFGIVSSFSMPVPPRRSGYPVYVCAYCTRCPGGAGRGSGDNSRGRAYTLQTPPACFLRKRQSCPLRSAAWKSTATRQSSSCFFLPLIVCVFFFFRRGSRTQTPSCTSSLWWRSWPGRWWNLSLTSWRNTSRLGAT